MPRDKNRKGLIIEFKKYNLDQDRNLKDTSLRALKQIDEGEYISQLKSHGIKETIKVGIAFQGKKVAIASNLKTNTDLSETEKIAKEMLKKEMNIKLISELTSLQEDEIKKLVDKK